MKFKLLNQGAERTYTLILEKGSEVIQAIIKFALKEKLKACRFKAIGAFSEATVDIFDFSIKDYTRHKIREQMEVLAVTGDISIHMKKPEVHAHAILGKKDGSVHGGHLLKGIVHPTLEIILTESLTQIEHQMDGNSGLPLVAF